MAFGFFKDLLSRFGGKTVDWDELEESLIRADIGVPMTLRIIKELQQRPAPEQVQRLAPEVRDDHAAGRDATQRVELGDSLHDDPRSGLTPLLQATAWKSAPG